MVHSLSSKHLEKKVKEYHNIQKRFGKIPTCQNSSRTMAETLSLKVGLKCALGRL